MKAKAWLILEVEETRRSGMSTYSLKVTGVRQTPPLDRLAVHVDIDIPNEVIMPKAKLLVEHEEDVRLALSPAPESSE